MKKNIGKSDKLVRLVVAALLVILFYTDVISGTIGIIAIIIAAVFSLTSLINSCPLYPIFGINTCSKKEK
ncbi:MAG: hypothetical protein B7C24_08170 [Bacteroidetes bacterium 4572_77]|nr:MAG: hypothetical protein B7C24_08170 [Bacteroidetes bacterium 4572_77]